MAEDRSENAKLHCVVAGVAAEKVAEQPADAVELVAKLVYRPPEHCHRTMLRCVLIRGTIYCAG